MIHRLTGVADHTLLFIVLDIVLDARDGQLRLQRHLHDLADLVWVVDGGTCLVGACVARLASEVHQYILVSHLDHVQPHALRELLQAEEWEHTQHAVIGLGVTLQLVNINHSCLCHNLLQIKET